MEHVPTTIPPMILPAVVCRRRLVVCAEHCDTRRRIEKSDDVCVCEIMVVEERDRVETFSCLGCEKAVCENVWVEGENGAGDVRADAQCLSSAWFGMSG